MSEAYTLRVCLVAGTYPPARCGIGDYTGLLAERIARTGAAVSVVTSSYLGTFHQDGNPAVLPVVESWSVTRAWKVLSAILKARPDVVHFQFPSTEYPGRVLFNLLVPMIKLLRERVTVLVTFHELPEPKLYRWKGIIRVWLTILGANGVIVVAPSQRATLYAICPLMRWIPCRVIPIAANIEASQLDRAQLQELRRRAGVREGALLLTYFGFVSPAKGLEQVLDALTILRTRGVPAELMIIAELSDANPYHEGLRARIVQSNLGDFVNVTGYLDRVTVANTIAMSDACIIPFTEGVHQKSGSFLAAVNQGVFTITTSWEKKGFVEKENVYYAKPGDVEEMVAAVQRYAGRKVAANFVARPTWAAVAQEHVELFAALLHSRKSGAFSKSVGERRKATNAR